MKRIMLILERVFLGFVALYPLGYALLLYFGYKLTFTSAPVFAIILSAVSVCVAVLDEICKDTLRHKVTCVLMGMAVPLSLVNIFLYILEHSQISVLISGVACFACCCILAIRHAKPMALKIVALALSALLALPVGLFAFIAVVFPIGQNTVVQTLESPTGRYYAELIDSDQGALGGDTVVYVYERWEINLLLLKIEKAPQTVYIGEWGEFEDMQIYWKDDRCLMINSADYEIE